MTETATDSLRSAIERAGARIGAPHGRPRAEAFDGLEPEYARLVESVAVLDDGDRALLRFTGPRARRMLNGLFTNDLSALDASRAVYGFVLTAKGRPVTDLRVLPFGGEMLLDVPAAGLDGVREHFRRYLPPIHATAELDDALARIGVAGPGAAAVVDAALGALERAGTRTDAAALGPLEVAGADPTPREPSGAGPEATGDAPRLRVVRREPAEGSGFDLYGQREILAAAWEALLEAAAGRGGPAGRAAWRIRRVELGLPVYGDDVSEGNLPQETGQEGRAISYEKGCYTGQEVVARIHYRGHVNRVLRGFRLPPDGADPAEGTAPPGPGDARDGVAPAPEDVAAGAPDAAAALPVWEGRELYREGRAAGVVTSAVRSPRLGPIALGYVRREVEVGERLAPGSGERPSVEICDLPFVVS